MLDDAENKDAAWSFMKWWTSDDIQTMFGREMESLMGAAARYPTANINALDSLPWPVDDYEQLKEQFQSVRGIPEVPGGYFTGRHLLNAFYSVVVNSADQKAMGITIKGDKAEPRETIVEYVQYMQEEIRNKRMEFGLEP
jgi:ABC-type glycerol-3-phosphate transport system substrate-binding protein